MRAGCANCDCSLAVQSILALHRKRSDFARRASISCAAVGCFKIPISVVKSFYDLMMEDPLKHPTPVCPLRQNCWLSAADSIGWQRFQWCERRCGIGRYSRRSQSGGRSGCWDAGLDRVVGSVDRPGLRDDRSARRHAAVSGRAAKSIPLAVTSIITWPPPATTARRGQQRYGNEQYGKSFHEDPFRRRMRVDCGRNGLINRAQAKNAASQSMRLENRSR